VIEIDMESVLLVSEGGGGDVIDVAGEGGGSDEGAGMIRGRGVDGVVNKCPIYRHLSIYIKMQLGSKLE
jgi:hypothetical protein